MEYQIFDLTYTLTTWCLCFSQYFGNTQHPLLSHFWVICTAFKFWQWLQCRTSSKCLIIEVYVLFKEHEELLEGFNQFLPRAYRSCENFGIEDAIVFVTRIKVLIRSCLLFKYNTTLWIIPCAGNLTRKCTHKHLICLHRTVSSTILKCLNLL